MKKKPAQTETPVTDQKVLNDLRRKYRGSVIQKVTRDLISGKIMIKLGPKIQIIPNWRAPHKHAHPTASMRSACNTFGIGRSMYPQVETGQVVG